MKFDYLMYELKILLPLNKPINMASKLDIMRTIFKIRKITEKKI